MRKHLFHLVMRRSLNTQAKARRIAVRPADRKLLHFKPATELNHHIENAFHDVGIDQVPLGFYNFADR